MPNVAINGLGRIGRAALKILLDDDGLDLVAVNDIADVENLAYLRHAGTALAHERYHEGASTASVARARLRTRIHPAETPTRRSPWADLHVRLTARMRRQPSSR